MALQAAMLVFWQKGFLATSMNDLYDAMGIRSPSLYAAFGCKEALYLEAMNHYVLTVGSPIWNRLMQGDTASTCVANFLAAGVEQLPQSGATPAGCMATLAAAGEELPEAILDAIKNIRMECLRTLRARLNEAVAEGELPAGTNVDRLSRFYWSVFQGMAMQARDGANSAELQGIAEAAMAAWPAMNAKPQDCANGSRPGP